VDLQEDTSISDKHVPILRGEVGVLGSSSYRVTRRARLGEIGQPELKNGEEMVWVNRGTWCRETERRAGSERVRENWLLYGQMGIRTQGELQTRPVK
jgi:hypothetical protein